MLKALYMLLKREPPPRTHRITTLYMELKEAGFNLPEDLEEELPSINKYYTITRHPDAANGLPSESVSREEALKTIRIARRVLEYVKEELSKHTRQDN